MNWIRIWILLCFLPDFGRLQALAESPEAPLDPYGHFLRSIEKLVESIQNTAPPSQPRRITSISPENTTSKEAAEMRVETVQTDALLEQAAKRMQIGNDTLAIELLTNALSTVRFDINRARLHTHIGQYFGVMLQYDKAESHLNQAMEFDRFHPEALIILAALLTEQGSANKALALLKDKELWLIDTPQFNVHLHLNRARAYAVLKQEGEAMRSFKEAGILNPEAAVSYGEYPEFDWMRLRKDFTDYIQELKKEIGVEKEFLF